MALTSIKNDNARVEKQLQEMTGLGRYILQVPGPGTNVPFFEDPHIRLQSFGANMKTNAINLESDLRGLTRHLNKDNIKDNNYNNNTYDSYDIKYESMEPFVEESRAIMPAWTLLGKESNRWNYLHTNPQNNVFKHFQDNISSRLEQKDNFKRNYPCN